MLFKRFIQAFLMPFFVLLIQLFFRFLFEQQIWGVGISFAAIALAQMFPYLFIDNLILLKVYSLGAKYDGIENNLVTKYTFEIKKTSKQIQTLKNITIALFVLILALFIVTLGLAFKTNYYNYNNLTGGFSVILSMLYLIFA